MYAAVTKLSDLLPASEPSLTVGKAHLGVFQLAVAV